MKLIAILLLAILAGCSSLPAQHTDPAPQIVDARPIFAAHATVKKTTHLSIDPAVVTGDPTVGIMPAYLDAWPNWSNAGLQFIGGYPTRTTVCATVSPSLLIPPVASDDKVLIQAAIDACPNNQVVVLAAGTVTSINASISGNTLTLNSGTLFRGAAILDSSGRLEPGTDVVSGSGGTWTISMPPIPGATITNQTLAVSTQFNISVTENILINKPITLRGSGGCAEIYVYQSVCKTILNLYDGGIADWAKSPPNIAVECGTVSTSVSASCNQQVGTIFLSSSSPDEAAWGGCGSNATNGGPTNINPTTVNCGTTLTADAAMGDSRVEVSSTTNFVVGRWVMIDENPIVTSQTDPSGGTNIDASADWKSTSPTPVTMRLAGGDEPSDYSFYPNRVNSELHKIAGIGATQCPGGTSKTICFDDPLMMAFRSSGSHDARLYWPTINFGSVGDFLEKAGVEGFSITRDAGNGGGVEFTFCAYCWAKSMDIGGWMAGAINSTNSARILIDTVYVHLTFHGTNDGAEYPIGLSERTTEAMIVNSVDVYGGKGMVGRAASGNVVAYNYVDKTIYETVSHGIGDWFVEFGANGSHYAGPHHWLIEGNWTPNCDNDDTHGNNTYMTEFGNHCTGLRTDFTDFTANLSVSDTSNIGWTNPGTGVQHQDPGFKRAAGPMANNYWHGFINNLLGTAGITDTSHGWTYHDSSQAQPSKVMWDSGWTNLSPNGDPNLNGINSIQFIFRHGNYDYVTASVADFTSGFSHTMPASFIFAAKPSFFTGVSCTYSWPWITPQATTKVNNNSCGGSGNPAKARWDNGAPLGAQP